MSQEMSGNLIVKYLVEQQEGENTTIKFVIDQEESILVALLEELHFTWHSNREQWRVASAREDDCILWVGYAGNRIEAILEYLKSRLGRGYGYSQLEAYEAGNLSVEQFAQNLDLELAVLQNFLRVGLNS